MKKIPSVFHSSTFAGRRTMQTCRDERYWKTQNVLTRRRFTHHRGCKHLWRSRQPIQHRHFRGDCSWWWFLFPAWHSWKGNAGAELDESHERDGGRKLPRVSSNWGPLLAPLLARAGGRWMNEWHGYYRGSGCVCHPYHSVDKHG